MRNVVAGVLLEEEEGKEEQNVKQTVRPLVRKAQPSLLVIDDAC